MASYSLESPVFVSFLIAAALMVLKLMGQGWMTVVKMIRGDAGLLDPEDLLPGPANRNPRPDQLEPNEEVERSRRIHRNDMENILPFLACGLAYVAVAPPPAPAAGSFIAFVVARFAHTLAYATGRRHEARAALFSVGSIVVIVMALHVPFAALMAI